MNEQNRMIFVGGPPRSGTTLVQNVLDSHAEIFGGPEFLHLPDIITLRKKIHLSISREHLTGLCTKESIDSYLRSFARKFFLPLADAEGCRFYSEKTPMNILVFSELIDLFPEAHFILVVRDPRAIVSSMAQVRRRALSKGMSPPYFTATIEDSIGYIQRCYGRGFAAAAAHPSKVLTIVYEDLVADPEKESRKICDFLEVDWDAAMLYPGEQSHAGEQAITTGSDELWYDAETYNRNIDTSGLTKWKQTLTVAEQVGVTMGFSGNRELEACGYDLSMASLSPASLIQVHGYQLFRRGRNRIRSFFSRGDGQ